MRLRQQKTSIRGCGNAFSGGKAANGWTRSDHCWSVSNPKDHALSTLEREPIFRQQYERRTPAKSQSPLTFGGHLGASSLVNPLDDGDAEKFRDQLNRNRGEGVHVTVESVDPPAVVHVSLRDFIGHFEHLQKLSIASVGFVHRRTVVVNQQHRNMQRKEGKCGIS